MKILTVIVGINHWQDVTHIFLDSILKYESNPRIAVIDNFSDVPYAHDRCWIVRSEKRLGFPAAINLALDTFTDWDKVIVFNNDCWCSGRYLDKVAECDENTFYGSAWNQPIDGKILVYSAWMVISKKVWELVGRFDEEMEAGWEDFDYELRCQKLGVLIDVLNIPVNHTAKSTRLEERDYLDRWDKTRLVYSRKHGIETVKMNGEKD